MEAFLDGVLERACAVAQSAEVFAVTQRETPIRFRANRLKSVQTRETSGVALRLIKDGRIGFASTSRLEDPQALVDAALEVAPFGAEAHFTFPTPQEYTALASHDPAIASLPVETMVDWGNAVVAGVREVNADILVEAGLSKDVSTTTVRNSAGGGGSFDKTAFAVWVWANLVRDTDMLDVYEWQATGQGLLDLDAMVAAVTEKVRLAERNVSVATRPMPVIFTPKGFSMTMLDSLERGFSGKLALEGASPLADKLGQLAFDPRFRLHDDGLVAKSPAGAPFDGEGVPTRRTLLVEDGVVHAFLYDLQTAGQAGVQSTGNASRDLDSLPSPGTHAWLVEPGEAGLPDILAQIEEGLLVDQVMGAWAGNVVAGEFSGNVHLGYKIEKGELVGRVKDTMVAGNVYTALKEKLGAVGDTGFWVGGTFRAPHLMFTSLGVASKE
jgi:PmbA protein